MLVIKCCVLALFTMYVVHRAIFVVLSHRISKSERTPDLLEALPLVTIQLPVFNERHVISRLLTGIFALDYPADKLQIQILDDSTDDTSTIINTFLSAADRTLDVDHIRRSHRAGYKAGALARGLDSAKGEFIAVFDADFVPAKDFLLRVLPLFKLGVGAVQASWSFVNSDDNVLTQVQALLLKSHFTIEQRVRSHRGYKLHFNGSAGIWRKQAILSAGGWHSDTVTEDLDLSYRAQLKGWSIVFLEGLDVCSELPATLRSFINQQFRWSKGTAQTLRKLSKDILFSSWPIHVKMEAIFHLTDQTQYAFVLILLVLGSITPPSPLVGGVAEMVFAGLSGVTLWFYLVGTLPVSVVGKVKYFLSVFLIAPILMITCVTGMISGMLVKGGSFVRTPKKGSASCLGYYSPRWNSLYGGCLLIAITLMTVAIKGVCQGLWGGVIFSMLFSTVAFVSLLIVVLERRIKNNNSPNKY